MKKREERIHPLFRADHVCAGRYAEIDVLQKEVAKAVVATDVKSKLDSLGFEAIADTPAHFAARIKAAVPK